MHSPRLTSLLAALCLLMPACSDEGAPPSLEDVRSEIQPTQQSWDVHYVVSETGGENDASLPRMEILAYHMATYETDDSTYTVMRGDTTGDRVVAYLYDEVGDTSATVNADRLILHEMDRRFEARGGVVVHTPESKTLESEHLVWLEDDRSIRTPGFVRIRTPKERIQGYNLVADEDLETYSLARVTGLVEIEEDEDTGEMDPARLNDEDTGEMDPSGLNMGDEDAEDTGRRDADADGAAVARPDTGSGDRTAPPRESEEEG